ncbi:hypothetical protein GBAR_LOCUS19873, partial [Geodia barretti]
MNSTISTLLYNATSITSCGQLLQHSLIESSPHQRSLLGSKEGISLHDFKVPINISPTPP